MAFFRQRAVLSVAVLLAACSNDGPSYELHPGGDGGVEEGGVDAAADASTPPPEASVEASVEASAEASPEASAEAGAPYPALLSETGLYADLKTETLGTGVKAYQPKYVLWSDGAMKRRWLYLPPLKQIDTSDMDFWSYPVGTTAWKEFTRDGKRVETRMLRKAGPNPQDWVMMAYAWKADQSDAVAVPEGVTNAQGTPHDIPEEALCHRCHGNMPDVLLGVTAIQLSHNLPGVTLDELKTEGRLSDPPAGPFTLPGGPVAEAALGYLHANCGTCHNAQSFVHTTVAMELWERTAEIDTVEHTRPYVTAVGQPNSFSSLHTIEPGFPDKSAIIVRMSSRNPSVQMPPVATEIVDPDGIAKVRTWISSLPPLGDGGGPDAAPPDASPSDGAPTDASSPDSGGARDGG